MPIYNYMYVKHFGFKKIYKKYNNNNIDHNMA